MSIDCLVLDAVEVGVSATEYTIKFLEINQYLAIIKPNFTFEEINKESYLRTKNYFLANKDK